jgi:hypothetical protein
VLSALLLLLLASTSMLNVKSANASYTATQWGHDSPNYNSDEVDMEYWICDEITGDFSDASWGSMDQYGGYTNQAYVDSILQGIQNPNNGIDGAAAWWVGDFIRSNISGIWHWTFYGDQYVYIPDYTVYQDVNYYRASREYFDFIWTCANGGIQWNDTYGHETMIPGINEGALSESDPLPVNTNTLYGYIDSNSRAVGMPLAWNGGSGSMSLDGYSDSDSGNYCYIGFENNSPALITTPEAGWTYTDYQYACFPAYFYLYALGYWTNGVHQSVRDSLDFASSATFGMEFSVFSSSILCHGYWVNNPGMGGLLACRMRVFGNSNMVLP